MWNNCKLTQNFFHIFFCIFSRIFWGFQHSSGYGGGKEVRKENLTLCKIDIAFLGKILKRAGIAQVKKVLILTLDNNGKVFIQEKGQQYQTFSVKFNGGESW